jgi:hypothetical protein
VKLGLFACLIASAAAAQTSPEVPASAAPAASEPAVEPAPTPAPPPSCAQLSSRALSADLKAATAQSQNQALELQVKLYDEAIAQWGQALTGCEGRARERAQRNLADSQRSREQLAEKLGAGSQCEGAHRDAAALQELARTAFADRRWPEAAALYRKAEGMWELATEQCSGSQQQTALKRREQVEIDGHNAEFCAPPFERAREFSTRLRNQGAALALAERQTQSQIAETLWRDTAKTCKGAAAELALNNAAALARERGTPWVATALPGAAATAPAVKPGPALVAKPAPARPTPTATATPPAAAVAPALAAAAPPAPEGPKLFDMRAGDTRYLGQFVREEGQVVSGTGRVEWANGDVYEGPLVKGRREGQGEIRWASGQRYKGQWSDDRPSGKGQLFFANGNQYEGTVVDGEPDGEGELLYATGDAYRGQIQRGLPHGKGVYRWTSGQRYEGDWVHDKPEGHGEMRFANGNVYTGPMVAGQPQGEGRMVFAGGEVYEGQFVAGRAEGRGRYRWKSGDRYEGEWARGLKHGHGVFTWASGDRWEGEFKDDEKTDLGELVRK